VGQPSIAAAINTTRRAAWRREQTLRLDPPKQHQDHNDNQNGADDADAAVAIAVAVAAEAAAKSPDQEDDKDNDEDESDRHGGVLSQIRTESSVLSERRGDSPKLDRKSDRFAPALDGESVQPSVDGSLYKNDHSNGLSAHSSLDLRMLVQDDLQQGTVDFDFVAVVGNQAQVAKYQVARQSE